MLEAVRLVGEQRQQRLSLVDSVAGPCVPADTGPGLHPGMGASVFDPYVRGKDHTQPGIGLGLATVKRIAQSHGGSVGVKSEPGHGARFWVELPSYLEPPVTISPGLTA